MKLRLFTLAMAAVTALSVAFVDVPAGKAVTGADFRPGRIIDDAVFYNKSSMTVDQIQQFLNSKVPSCDRDGTKPSEFGGGTRAQYGASRGYPAPYTCLKDYHENPDTHENNLEGRPIPSGAKSAAQIIYDAAQQHTINPQSLIVLLQKEQALVLDEWPFPIQYRKATGQGCPDTAACDDQFAGFYNQVMGAARQFRRYEENPNNYNHIAGQNNSVRWSPNAACGSSTVFIENQATAGLYNYTPYRPNQAALNNLYGTGDSCSAYGNRNFWRTFNDWFGTTILVSQVWDGTSLRRAKKYTFGNGHQVFSSSATQVLDSSWWPGSNGVQTSVSLNVPPGEKIVDFDKLTHPDNKTQSLFAATKTGVYMKVWGPAGHEPLTKIVNLPNTKRIVADIQPGASPTTYRLYVLANDGPYEVWWRDTSEISNPYRLWNINHGLDIIKTNDPAGKEEVYVATDGEVYRMKWPVASGIDRQKVTAIFGTVGVDKHNLADSTELLYTTTRDAVYETWWRPDTGFSNAYRITSISGESIVDSEKTVTDGVHQVYIGTNKAAYEYWWRPGGKISSSRLVQRDGLLSIDKVNLGAFQNVYTTTHNSVYETWWGRGASGTGTILKL